MIWYFLATTVVRNHVFGRWMAVSRLEEQQRERWRGRMRVAKSLAK